MELSETRGKKEGNADETKVEKQNWQKSSIILGLGFFYASNSHSNSTQIPQIGETSTLLPC